MRNTSSSTATPEHRPALKGVAAALALLALWAAPAAYATNGYFSHGYGVKALGQAGVGIAWAQDSLAAASNPAGTANIASRADAGLSVFLPSRGASIQGNAFGADTNDSADGKKTFFIPEIGYATALGKDLAAGIAVYGNGGLNTQYETNPYARFGASGRAGVNLEQLFISPSVAWKPAVNHSIGLALNIAYQRFKAQGIGFFGGFSQEGAQVSDLGTDSSLGVGLRLGWQGTVAPGLTLGATWASKVHGKFDKYRGLFADNGGFDIPENFGFGLQFAVTPNWTVGADWQEIRYSQVGAVGNSLAGLLRGVPLGAANGPGFGWQDVKVFKLATSHQVGSALVLRAGYSHASQTVPAGETFFNILAPGVVQDHYTVGATWALAGGAELSGFAAVAPNKTINGSASIPPGNPPAGFGGGNANVRLKETIFGVSWGWKY